MRLRERDKVGVTVHGYAGMDDDVYLWAEGQRIRAAIYPDTSAIHAQIYGDALKDMRLLLYEGDAALAPGMGVCTDGSGVCDYRIVSVQRWDHLRVSLAFIPEGRRESCLK